MEDGPQNIKFNITKTKYIQKESLLLGYSFKNYIHA